MDGLRGYSKKRRRRYEDEEKAPRSHFCSGDVQEEKERRDRGREKRRGE